MAKFYEKFRNKKIKYHLLRNYSEVIDVLRNVYPKPPEEKNKHEHEHKQLWFRGSIDAGLNLIPSLYWCDEVEGDPNKLEEAQEKFLSYFQTRRIHKLFKNQPNGHLLPRPESTLNWLSLMEHYQATTCYLNWSLKPEVGLFFALEYLFNSQIKKPKKEFSCLWVLKPCEMNEHIWLGDKSEGRNRNELIDKYIQVKSIKNTMPTFYDIEKEIREGKVDGAEKENEENNKIIRHRYQSNYPSRPINVFPQVNSDRILSQKGIFTIFPVKPRKENYYLRSLDSYPNSNLFLECIILTDPKQIKHDLNLLGFDPYDVYPEISYRPGMVDRR